MNNCGFLHARLSTHCVIWLLFPTGLKQSVMANLKCKNSNFGTPKIQQ